MGRSTTNQKQPSPPFLGVIETIFLDGLCGFMTLRHANIVA
jgi:hypothetical protein